VVASKLAAYPPEARGAGLLHRLAAESQRDFLNVALGRRCEMRPPAAAMV
jgi:hypothetical protein